MHKHFGYQVVGHYHGIDYVYLLSKVIDLDFFM